MITRFILLWQMSSPSQSHTRLGKLLTWDTCSWVKLFLSLLVNSLESLLCSPRKSDLLNTWSQAVMALTAMSYISPSRPGLATWGQASFWCSCVASNQSCERKKPWEEGTCLLSLGAAFKPRHSPSSGVWMCHFNVVATACNSEVFMSVH